MTPADLKAQRTSDLKKAVTLRAQQLEPEGRCMDAAKEMIPQWAYEQGKCERPCLTSLAEAIDVHKGDLSRLFSGVSPQKEARLKLEAHLGLTPSSAGGMTDVLSVIERLQGREI